MGGGHADAQVREADIDQTGTNLGLLWIRELPLPISGTLGDSFDRSEPVSLFVMGLSSL